MRVKGKARQWSAIATMPAVAMLVTVSGCRNELMDLDVDEPEPEAYTVTFERQGGVGGSTSVTATMGQPMPVAMAPSKAGVLFDGYYTSPNGSGAQYYTAAMESARDWDIPANTELIANWVYEIGATGPAGGIVFYDKGEYTDGWRYLEAWTADEEGIHQWKTNTTSTPGTTTGVGSGYQNTYSAMLGTLHPAAEVVRNAAHGGYDDWFLPSKDELNLMYENLHEEGLGGFGSDVYWSSSEIFEDGAWAQTFVNGNDFVNDKNGIARARAARAF